jgi:hypothetical protein
MHDQVHGPEPLTADTNPAEHSPDDGAVAVAPPFALPHTPFTGGSFSGAEHCAVLPPLPPAHDQVHGPLPATEDAEPLLHNPIDGAVIVATPFAAPHAPFEKPAGTGAEHEALFGLFAPWHVQVHGPVPETAVGVPPLQSPVFGVLVACTPFALPQAPSAIPLSTGAEHMTFAPPLPPKHVHIHGPLPVTLMVCPTLQRFAVGIVTVATPFAEPHTAANTYWQMPPMHVAPGPAEHEVPSSLLA